MEHPHRPRRPTQCASWPRHHGHPRLPRPHVVDACADTVTTLGCTAVPTPRAVVRETAPSPASHTTSFTEGLRARVGELLSDVGLPAEFADRYPHELSGGQRQRASITRALATEPDLLLCDEVTSALDPTTAAAILELLTHLRTERQLTLVLVSHELHLITAYTDSVHLLNQGRIFDSSRLQDISRQSG